MAYCTEDEVREAGAQIGTTFSDAYINAVIERASRFFDHLCGVEDEFFEPAGMTATTKIVYGDGGPYLRLPPYVAGTLNTTLDVPDGYTVPSFVERDGYLVLSSSPSGTLLTRSVVGLNSSGWWDGLPNLNLLDLERQPLREKYPPRVKQVADFYRAQGAVLV
jgi:hypothetical protein